MSWTSDLVAGVAQMISDAGIGTWKASGTYLASDPWPISVGALADKPDRVITLAAWGGTPNHSRADYLQPLQIRYRGQMDMRTVETVGDAVFDLLEGVGPVTIAGVAVTVIQRANSIPLGRDEANRWMRSDNYYLSTARPTASRPD